MEIIHNMGKSRITEPSSRPSCVIELASWATKTVVAAQMVVSVNSMKYD